VRLLIYRLRGQDRWFESTAAHHGFRNANRGRGKTVGRDDAVAALDPYLDDELLEQRLALTWRAMEHRISNRFLRAANGFLAWRLGANCGVAQVIALGAKLSQSTLERVDSTAEPRLGQPAVLEGAVVALHSRLGSRDLRLQTSELGCGVGRFLGDT